MPRFYCYRCSNFTVHEENTCSLCGGFRESALTRKASKLNAKVSLLNYEWVVTGIYEKGLVYYLTVENQWALDKDKAHIFHDKREATEAFETVERPFVDFYPNIVQFLEGEEI